MKYLLLVILLMITHVGAAEIIVGIEEGHYRLLPESTNKECDESPHIAFVPEGKFNGIQTWTLVLSDRITIPMINAEGLTASEVIEEEGRDCDFVTSATINREDLEKIISVITKTCEGSDEILMQSKTEVYGRKTDGVSEVVFSMMLSGLETETLHSRCIFRKISRSDQIE